MQNREHYVQVLDEVRERLNQLRREAPSPAIEHLMHTADLYSHMALWLLGEERELTPEANE